MSESNEHVVRPIRPRRRTKKWVAGVGSGLLVLVVSLVVLPVPVCEDRAFLCENTGSCQGYRQWLIGLRSGVWYQESRLEQFMRARHPLELAHRWTKYEGTTRNLLGRPLRRSHERPGPILSVGRVVLDRYADGLDAPAKLELYHVFATAPKERVEAEVAEIWEAMLASGASVQHR